MMEIMQMAMPFFGGKRFVTREFLSNETWIAPLTTSKLESLNGLGQAGTAGTATTANRVVTTASWLIGGSGANSGNAGWALAQAYADAARSAINAGGSVSWSEVSVGQYNNNTYTLFSSTQSFSNVDAGTAVLSVTPGWQSSGPITGGGSQEIWTASVTFTYTTGSATTGANTTAFGYTFLGGVGGLPPNYPTVTNVPVTPGGSYSIVVPSGGNVFIAYYE